MEKPLTHHEFLKRIAEAPASVLDNTVTGTRVLASTISSQSHIKRARNFWKALGPGLTTGAADDDPSGIATYSQTGAAYGFQLLWLSVFTFPLMSVVQEMCARIGLVTGRGLAANIRAFFPKWVLYICTLLLFVANTLNIGADLGAMAKATQLLYPHLDFKFLILLFALVGLGLQIYTTYDKYAKYLKYLALILLSYIFSAVSVHLDPKELFTHTVIPSITFSKDQIFLICGILGTTISPYLFFWQTSQEVEEEILKGQTTLESRLGTTRKEVNIMRQDVWSGMFLSNVVMFFIIAACAVTLFGTTGTTITTAADAASALRPIAGDSAYLLFALGIIGTGMLAIPILAGSASYAMSECFGWRFGLYRKLKEANAFYGVIIIATLIGVAMNFLNIDPIKALIYSAVANGMVAPVILALIIILSNSKKVMGEWKNHPLITAVGWVVTLLMVISGVAVIWSMFS